MSDFVTQQMEKKFFEEITEYIQSSYEEARKITGVQVHCANIDESIDFKTVGSILNELVLV